MGEMKNANKILVGRPEGNRLLGRSKRGWEANIRMNLRGIGRYGVDWIHLDREGPVAGSCEHSN